MKATKLLVIALSCMLVIGCKKNNTEDEPASPTPQYPVITMDSLKSYFPYKTGDRIIFTNGGLHITYTVNEATFVSKNDKMNVNITMDGTVSTYRTPFYMQLTAEVTNQHVLKSTFYVAMPSSDQYIYPKEDTYEYDTAKSGKLPDKFNYSNGTIVEKEYGLSYYVDGFGDKWHLDR